MPTSRELAHDPFARETAKHAHKRVAELEQTLARIHRLTERRSMFQNRCHLCGAPVRKGSRYCHAHDWAAGR